MKYLLAGFALVLVVFVGKAFLGSEPERASEVQQTDLGQEAVQSRMQSLQGGGMQTDPELKSLMASLLEQPELRETLADPAVMQAVRAGDMKTLMAHPKLKEFIELPSMRELRKHMPE
jgi:hypothetical protein